MFYILFVNLVRKQEKGNEHFESICRCMISELYSFFLFGEKKNGLPFSEVLIAFYFYVQEHEVDF